ncbi:MAG: biopolymer transporter ExbD [Saprospiraceae bacterium]|nr:biopolymer transporter ExbD [Saprospiraceae bacterium]
MGIKKRNKVSAEFSMSSLTDIIFLLLIFFMLTSSLVAPNSLNLKLPGSSKTSTTTVSDIDEVKISGSGRYYLNRKRISIEDLEKRFANMRRIKKSKRNILIAPDNDAPIEDVVAVMDLALRYDVNGRLAAEPE